MKLPPYFFVFDVESVGLHGEPFAVGWVVVDTATGAYVEQGIRVSSSELAVLGGGGTRRPNDVDVEWVRAHVLPAIADVYIVPGRGNIRRPFWNTWKGWEADGAMLAADVAWPVEARFLMECACYTYWHVGLPEVQAGPYPLIDIASVRLAKGLDPIATELRRDDEMPPHNPLADAKQSARLLMEALAL